MGTASTMTAIAEAIGMALPGSSSIPATHSSHSRMGAATGRQAVELAWYDLKPRTIMTDHAFENAVTALMAIGGSTNAIVHLIAMAGRAQVQLTLDDFDRVSQLTPVLGNLRPTGKYVMADLFDAGGVGALLNEIRDLLHLDCINVAGGTIGSALEGQQIYDADVIRRRDNPVGESGSLAVLGGNLCPDGAVIKPHAAEESLLEHTGPAIVFRNYAELKEKIDDPALELTPQHVVVLQNAGPLGAPGFPEWGMLPIPKYLLAQGVRDMVRISDARMSGTSYGACVLHVSPESFVGGPLALVRTGDSITLSVSKRTLNLNVSDDELSRRKADWQPEERVHSRGYSKLFYEETTQAHQGCDFRFLHDDGSHLPEPDIY